MTQRFFSRITEPKSKSRASHYAGMPPELSSGKDNRQRLPLPSLLVIEEQSDGVFLFRYTSNGEFSGDTWHRSVDDAKEQSQFEFRNALGVWTGIPDDVDDTLDFALAQIKASN